jgi:Domain of unknown function (DUF1917)
VRLPIEPVPRGLWGRNLRNAVPERWPEIRRGVLDAAENRCAVCGAADKVLECDEVWVYDDAEHVQTLVALRALCALCHGVKHFLRSVTLAKQGRMPKNAVGVLVAHALAVNGCTREEFTAHNAHALGVWTERSRHEWRVSFGDYERYRSAAPPDTGTHRFVLPPRLNAAPRRASTGGESRACACADALERVEGAGDVLGGYVYTAGQADGDEAANSADWFEARTLTGKWLLFPGCATAEDDWTTVCRARARGDLRLAKASLVAGGIDWGTGLPVHAIDVYTPDFRDVAHVQAIGRYLWRLGVVRQSRPIYYKTDKATLDGRYAESGRAVSLYSLAGPTAALALAGGAEALDPALREEISRRLAALSATGTRPDDGPLRARPAERLEQPLPGRLMAKRGPRRDGLKLAIQLVPKPLWRKSLHRRLRRRVWDSLRKQAIEQAGSVCAVCGAGGRLNGHEVWEYDDDAHVQRLREVTVLCNLCNAVAHIGHARTVVIRAGRLSDADLVRHFCAVNGCSEAAFREHEQAAWKQYHERSGHTWTQDFGDFDDLLFDEEGVFDEDDGYGFGEGPYFESPEEREHHDYLLDLAERDD